MLENKSELKTLFFNTYMLFILRISGYIFPLITFPYLTRALGASTYGIIVFVNAAIAYFKMIVEFGFTLSGTRTCSLNRRYKDKLEVITFSIIQGKFILCLAGFIVLIILIYGTSLFKGKELIMLISYLQLFPAVFITDYLFRGLEKMSVITYRSIAINILYTVAIILFIKKPGDYYLIPIIYFANNFVIAIWSWLYIYKEIGIKFQIVSLAKTYRAILDSISYFMANIASTVYSASNVVVLGVAGYSDTAIGQFGVANNLITMIRSIFSPIADSLYPYMVAKKNYKLIKLILLIGCPIVILGVVALYIWAHFLIVLLSGKGYLEAIPVFKIMLPLVVITLPQYLLGYSTLGAMGKVKEVNLTVVYASVVHIIGLVVLYLSNNLNIIHVAVLTLFSESVILITRVFYISKARKDLREANTEKNNTRQTICNTFESI